MYNFIHKVDIEVKMPIIGQPTQQWSEQGYVPDKVIRHGIRRLFAERLIETQHNDCADMADSQSSFIKNMHTTPIALVPDKANDQHYEDPAAFLDQALGKHRKYNCCYWAEDTYSLDDAETHALEETGRIVSTSTGVKF